MIKSTENSVLRITNKIFHHHDIKLADDFENVSKQHLDTGLIAVNFEDENLTQIIAVLNRYCYYYLMQPITYAIICGRLIC